MTSRQRPEVPYQDSDVPPLDIYESQLEGVTTDPTPREHSASEKADIAAVSAAIQTEITDEVPELVEGDEPPVDEERERRIAETRRWLAAHNYKIVKWDDGSEHKAYYTDGFY